MGTPGTPEITTYTVKQGDTLWEIARMHGTDVESLAAINDIASREYLQPGQRVTVLSTPGLLCKVGPGDTLWGISSTYGIPVNEITEANRLESSTLAVGQVLILPGAKPAAVVTARAASLSSQAVPGFAWPLNGRLTSPFGRRWGRMHEGIDIAAAHGTEVKAARAGVVTFAGWYGGGYGNTVVLDHGDGITSVYAHLSRVSVNRDSSVLQGQALGSVGSTGFAFGPHLHFEILVNGVPQDPASSLP
jgi:murein DD-endopeptidase MepM/ murein hydrolase activator NlpD